MPGLGNITDLETNLAVITDSTDYDCSSTTKLDICTKLYANILNYSIIPSIKHWLNVWFINMLKMKEVDFPSNLSYLISWTIMIHGL